MQIRWLFLAFDLREGLALKTIPTPAGAGEAIIQFAAAFANPADPAGGDACHQGIIGDVMGNDGPCGSQGAATEGVAADDGAVRAQARALAYARTRKKTMCGKVCARGVDIRENAGRTAEDIVFQVHAFVDGNVVLDPDPVANPDAGAYVDILSERAVCTDDGAGLDMAEMPYLGTGSDGRTCVHVAALMHEPVLHFGELQYFYIVPLLQGAGDVFRVKNGFGVLLHETVVHRRVGRRNDDDVSAGD